MRAAYFFSKIICSFKPGKRNRGYHSRPYTKYVTPQWSFPLLFFFPVSWLLGWETAVFCLAFDFLTYFSVSDRTRSEASTAASSLLFQVLPRFFRYFPLISDYFSLFYLVASMFCLVFSGMQLECRSVVALLEMISKKIFNPRSSS